MRETGGLNLYGFISNRGINLSDYLGLISQGDNFDVTCPLGEGIQGPQQLMGNVIVDRYHDRGNGDGTYWDLQNNKVKGASIEFKLIFNKTAECPCCDEIQFKQTIIQDDSPSHLGEAIPRYDGDGARRPFYRESAGNPPSLLDIPSEPATSLWPLNPNGPMTVTVKFKTQVICIQKSVEPEEDSLDPNAGMTYHVLLELEWGFKFEATVNEVGGTNYDTTLL